MSLAETRERREKGTWPTTTPTRRGFSPPMACCAAPRKGGGKEGKGRKELRQEISGDNQDGGRPRQLTIKLFEVAPTIHREEGKEGERKEKKERSFPTRSGADRDRDYLSAQFRRRSIERGEGREGGREKEKSLFPRKKRGKKSGPFPATSPLFPSCGTRGKEKKEERRSGFSPATVVAARGASHRRGQRKRGKKSISSGIVAV